MHTDLSDIEKEFIKTHIQSDTSQLLLSKKYQTIPRLGFLVEQIAARQKIQHKLPSWYQNFELILPPTINLEQSSSELTAEFKSKIVSGIEMADCTGGMGIDFFALMQSFEKGTFIDQNERLFTAAQYNSQFFTNKPIECFHADSLSFLNSCTKSFDLIYIDPARRGTAGQKVYQLSDCEPNVVENLGILQGKARQILIKTSPILDIQQAIKQLQSVDHVYVLQVKNEVKELLFLLKKVKNENPQISVVELNQSIENQLNYQWQQEQEASVIYSEPQQYIYEPSAGILKAGAFKIISQKFNLNKLQENTHLYTANKLVDNFPGRVFELQAQLKPDKKEINQYLKLPKAHITVRNFPSNVVELRKKWALQDGGDDYLLVCTLLHNKKVVLASKKISQNLNDL